VSAAVNLLDATSLLSSIGTIGIAVVLVTCCRSSRWPCSSRSRRSRSRLSAAAGRATARSGSPPLGVA
jgi:hypothetical protein